MTLPAPSVMDIALTKSAEILPELKIPHLIILSDSKDFVWLGDEGVILDGMIYLLIIDIIRYT